MRRVLLIAVLLAALLPTASWAAPVRSVAYVYAPTQFTFDFVRLFDLVIEESDRPDYLRIVAPRETIRQLVLTGFEVDVVIDDLDAWVAARSQHIRSLPVKSSSSKVTLDHFLDNTELGTFLNDLATAHPDIMSVETIGSTNLGKPLYLVKISDNVSLNENEPAIFFENTAHGDEIVAYTQGLHIIQWLVENYGINSDITEVVDNDEIFFVPLTNPDGNYDDPIYGRSRYNDNGVDLNRNNGYMWVTGSTYGPSPHSEPETQALLSVWGGTQPFVISQSGHSGTTAVSLPWSFHYDEPPDWAEADYLGEQYCYPNYCEDPDLTDWFQGSWGMYQMNGSTKDQYYGSFGAMAWTTEMSYTKELNWSEAAEIIVQHEPAMLFLMQEIQQGLHGSVLDKDSGDPIAALIEIDGKWSTFSDAEVGDFHKYLRPGTYDVRIYANGYEEYTDSVSIAEGSPTQLDVELEPSADPVAFAWRWLISVCPNAEETSSHTIDTLGPPDGEFYSLGNNGYAIIDLGPAGIDDGDGADIAVYEGYSDGDENFALYGSTGDYLGPWTLIGNGTGTSSFDIGTAGFGNVRYVKILDTADEDPADAAAYDGYDLDAIGSPGLFASFTADPTSGSPPLTVQFTDLSGGNPEAWEWDFGDGNSSTEQNPQHVYANEGVYTVSLTITKDGLTNELVREDYITVAVTAPVAAFSGTPTAGEAPLEVAFTDESTGTVESWAWLFGDGGTSTEQNPVYTYAAPGKYTVKLTVTGPGGSNQKTRFNYITVTCPTPAADFAGDVVTGPAPLTVNFANLTDTPTGCACTYSWTFGDGGTSTEESPAHIYQTPGTYTVALRAVSNGGSDNEQKVGYITVTGDDDDDLDDDSDADDDNDDDVAPTDDDNDADEAGGDDDDSGCGR